MSVFRGNSVGMRIEGESVHVVFGYDGSECEVEIDMSWQEAMKLGCHIVAFGMAASPMEVSLEDIKAMLTSMNDQALAQATDHMRKKVTDHGDGCDC